MEKNTRGVSVQAFWDYFGGMGFLNMLFVYFPIGVAIISVLLTLLFRKTFVPVIVVSLIFGSFFIYTYTQFNATFENFLIPLIIYILIAFLLGKITKKFVIKA